jgi:hypothetical protein
MQRHIALRRVHAFIVLLGLIIGVSRHQQGFARPFRIWIFAIHLVEFLGRFLVVLLRVQQIQAFVVEHVGGIFGNVVVILLEQAAATRKRQSQRNANERRGEAGC